MPQLYITKAKVLGKKKKETTNEPQELWTMSRQVRSTLTNKLAVDNYDDDGFGYETDVS